MEAHLAALIYAYLDGRLDAFAIGVPVCWQP